MYKLIWTTIWGTLGLFRHYRGVHYVYLSTIKGCIIAIRGYCTPQKRPSENTANAMPLVHWYNCSLCGINDINICIYVDASKCYNIMRISHS